MLFLKENTTLVASSLSSSREGISSASSTDNELPSSLKINSSDEAIYGSTDSESEDSFIDVKRYQKRSTDQENFFNIQEVGDTSRDIEKFSKKRKKIILKAFNNDREIKVKLQSIKRYLSKYNFPEEDTNKIDNTELSNDLRDVMCKIDLYNNVFNFISTYYDFTNQQRKNEIYNKVCESFMNDTRKVLHGIVANTTNQNKKNKKKIQFSSIQKSFEEEIETVVMMYKLILCLIFEDKVVNEVYNTDPSKPDNKLFR